MCGIIGIMLNEEENVSEKLLECVTKLEYRGYDSVGIATYDNDNIHIKKDQGDIESVDKQLNLSDMPGSFGIAHVRWASTGRPTKLNAHPHIDEKQDVAVVHNGTITNYSKIKQKLADEGHKFISQTDTEIIPHLIKKHMLEGYDLEHALRMSIKLLEGTYAIVAISKDEPDKIVACRKDSPLVVGLADDGYYLASDVPAIVKYTRNIIYPDEGEIVILTPDEVVIHDEHDNIVYKNIEITEWTEEMVNKEPYEHYMIKEIHEQEGAVKNTLAEKENIQKVIDSLEDIKRICFVACGTSYHASLSGKYIIETTTNIPTDVLLASEFKYSANTFDENTLVVFISQSGETLDSLKALKLAKEKSKTLAIVNVKGSSIYREADYTILTRAGPEIGVAATKTYIAQLTSIYLFAALLGKDEKLLKQLYDVPEYISEVLEDKDEIKLISKRYSFAKDLFYLGKGFSYPTALEAALKMKEISYIHAEGYASGELKHGPLALIDYTMPVIVIIPPGEDYDETMKNLEEVKSRKAIVLSIGARYDGDIMDKSNDVIEINPEVTEKIAPLVYIVALQLLAYYITVEKNHSPDRPRNLAKSVTV